MIDPRWIISRVGEESKHMTDDDYNQLQDYIAGAVFNLTVSIRFIEKALKAILIVGLSELGLAIGILLSILERI